MKTIIRVSAAVAAMAVVSMSMAQNVVGAWKGKMELDMSVVPKGQNADQQKAMVEMIKKMMGNMTMNLTLNSDKTFTMVVTGLPANPQTQQKAKEQKAKGKWVQKGSTITLTVTEANGAKPKGENKPQNLTVSKDGKKLILIPNAPGAQLGKSRVVFTR